MFPKISVIINCFNSDKYLLECIESVIAQSYTDFEVIFWDNQSTDSSAQIAKSFNDERIKYLLAPNHTTLGLARNLAAAKASGEWIAFLDADDLWAKDKLKRQVELIESSSTKLGLVYSRVDIISEADSNKPMIKQYIRIINKIKEHSEKNIFERLLRGNYIIFSSLLVKKESFYNVGGIDPSLEQNEDYDLILKISTSNTAVCTNENLASYRIHASNNSLKNGLKNFEEMDVIFSSLPQTPFMYDAVRQNKTKFGLFLLLNKKYKQGMKLLIKDGDLIFALKLIFNKIKGN